MKFFENFLKFLKDNIPNTNIPIWAAIVAFSAVVILIAIIICVATGSKHKKTKASDTAALSTSCGDTSDSAVSSANCEGMPTEHIINIEREIQTDANDNASVTSAASQDAPIDTISFTTTPEVVATESNNSVKQPSADECEKFDNITTAPVVASVTPAPAVMPTEKVTSAPAKSTENTASTTVDKMSTNVVHSVASPNSPVAKPVQNDGKTVYTKGVSGKALPATSIAKPLVNHTNDEITDTDKSTAAQPVKPIIAQPVKPVVQTSAATQLGKKSNTTSKPAATPLKSTVVKSSAPIAKPATKAAPKTEVKSATAKIESKPTTAKAEVKPSKIVKSIGDDSDTATFGKYAITVNKTNIMRPYKFELRANNGQLLFESEPYKVKPRLNSISAFKGHTKDGSFIIDEDKQGYFRFKLYNIKGELVGVGESYKSRAACENSIESTKRFAESATIIEDDTNA